MQQVGTGSNRALRGAAVRLFKGKHCVQQLGATLGYRDRQGS